MAGPFEEERWAFNDWGLMVEAINVFIMRGKSILSPPYILEDEALYLVRAQSLSAHPVDVERRLMLGKHAYSGSIVSLDQVDQHAVEEMLS
jgi:hypothetical protein